MKILLLYLSFLCPLVLLAQHQVAYLSNQSGNFDLFAIPQEGGAPEQLTKNLGWDWAPQWNDHLQAILYNSSDTARQFSILAVDRAGQQVDIDTKGMEEFILSPKGEYALYTLQDNKNRYIGIVDVALGTNHLLVVHPSYNGRPQWSPDGNYFSFISERDGNGELYLYKLATGQTMRLTTSDKREKYTSWMPDGQHLVYTYHYSDLRDQEHNDIFQINIMTGVIKQITKDDYFYQEIAVSPDGKRIAFHAKRDGKDQIYTIGIDGKNEKQLTTADAYHGEPCWIPKPLK